MEGLQELTKSTFQEEQQFAMSSSDFDVVGISVFPSTPTLYKQMAVSESTLKPSLAQDTPSMNGEDAVATLKVVRIYRDDNQFLCISKQTFLDIFYSFDMDPYALYMISRNCSGFHRFKVNTFFIRTAFYDLVWSFNPMGMRTRAILLLQRTNGLRGGDSAFEEFKSILQLYRDQIYTPCLLAFVTSVHIIHITDEVLVKGGNDIRSIEAGTGHGSWGYRRRGAHGQDDSFDIREITESSRRISVRLSHLANQLLHEEIAASILSFMLEQGDSSDWRKGLQDMYLHKHDDCTELLKSVIPMLQKQTGSAKLYVNYLQENAKSQSSVVRFLANYSLLPST
jgi:hypothetical protein